MRSNKFRTMKNIIKVNSSFIGINNECMEFNDFIFNLFSPWQSDCDNPDHEFLITTSGKGYLFCDGENNIYCVSKEFLLSQLEYSLAVLIKDISSDHLHFHASCIDLNGKGVLIVGLQSSGKTTIAVKGLLNGFKSLGDDIVLVKNGSGEVTGFPRPFKLTDYTFGIIPHEILNKYPHYYIEKDLTYFFFNVTSGDFYSESTDLKCIIFPVIKKGPFKVKQLGQIDALTKLMPHNFNLFDNNSENIKQITDLIKNVPAYEISFFESNDIISFCKDLFI